MPLTDVTTTFNLSDYIGGNFDPRRTKVYLTTNVDSNRISDKSTGEIRVGGGTVTVAADGAVSATTWAPGVDANPASWQTTFNIDYVDAGTRQRQTMRVGPFTITASGLLTALIDEQDVPAEYLTTVTAQLDTYTETAAASATSAAASASSAATSADLAQDLITSDLGTTDGQTRALIEDPASQTATALTASIGAALGVGAINAWQHWGDSMTSDTAFSGYWTDKFEALNTFAATSYNIAQPGETAAQIFVRVRDQGSSVRDRRFTIGAGRNGFKTDNPLNIVNLIRQSIAYFDAKAEGFVFDIPPFTDDTTTDIARRKVLDEALAFAFPDLWLPLWSKLRTTEAATAAGITFNATDLADIEAGNTPSSFRSDNGHINNAGGTAVAYFLQKHAYLRGYVTAIPPIPAPNLIVNSGFETDLTDWAGQGGTPAAITRNTTEFRSGVASMRVQFSSDSSSRAALTARPALSPGSVTGKAWIKATAGATLVLRVTTVNGSNAPLANIDQALTTTGDWQEVTASGTAGAGTAAAYMEVRKSSGSAATPVVYVDDVTLRQA